MENKIPSFSKYVNTQDIIQLFNFIMKLANQKGLPNLNTIENLITEETIKPSPNINHGAYENDKEVQILYYNIPRIFENLLNALEKPINEIQSGTLIKDENLNKFIPAYLESKESELDKVLPTYDFRNMEVVPDEFAEVFELITDTNISFNTTIKDLPIGSRILLNIKGTPTRFIIVHHGIPYKHKAEEDWKGGISDYYPRYDDTVKGTWLLMEEVWEENTENYKNSFYLDGNSLGMKNYAIKNQIHPIYWQDIQPYSYFNKYFNDTFFYYFDENVQKIIKNINLPMQKNCFITENGKQEIVLSKSLIGHNPVLNKQPSTEEEENKIYKECYNNPLVHSPFKAKIFPLSWTEVNYPTPWLVEKVDEKYNDKVVKGAMNPFTGGELKYKDLIGFGHDYVDGGYLKYFEDNTDFERADLFQMENKANNGIAAELRKKTKYKRKAKINDKYVAYNLRSGYYNEIGELAHIDEYGNLGKGCSELKNNPNNQYEKIHIYRFRPALILPFETGIKTDENKQLNFKYYAYKPSVDEWIRRAKELYNELNNK